MVNPRNESFVLRKYSLAKMRSAYFDNGSFVCSRCGKELGVGDRVFKKGQNKTVRNRYVCQECHNALYFSPEGEEPQIERSEQAECLIDHKPCSRPHLRDLGFLGACALPMGDDQVWKCVRFKGAIPEMLRREEIERLKQKINNLSLERKSPFKRLRGFLHMILHGKI
jgi:DNA-directed RNA polymerase subunit RPC12/RpoP